MTLKQSQPRALTEISWSGTMLNVYTIILMLFGPIWCGTMLADGLWPGPLILLVLLGGMIALSLTPKTLFSYDPVGQRFIKPDGDSMRLEDLAMIEMDAHDIYFIPKTHQIPGWHLCRRGWITAPRRVLMSQAEIYNWPIKDITHPISRLGSWIVP